jgi:hypothetical protein
VVLGAGVVPEEGAVLVEGVLGGRRETIFCEKFLTVAKNGLIATVFPDFSTVSEEQTFS